MRIPMDFQMAIANAAVVPSMNPAGAGILYAEEGAQVSSNEWNGDGYRTGLKCGLHQKGSEI